MDYGDQSDIGPDDLFEICMMSLQDLEPTDAASLVLKYKMSESLKDGQIKNIAVEMQKDKLWEEYADEKMHESFFNIGSLLYSAMPKEFPKPDAVLISLNIKAKNETAK